MGKKGEGVTNSFPFGNTIVRKILFFVSPLPILFKFLLFLYSINFVFIRRPHQDCNRQKKLETCTRYPIEGYVGWAVTSSKFIFNISGVIPLFENHFFVFENFAAKSMDWFMHSYIANNFKHQTSNYNNIVKFKGGTKFFFWVAILGAC